MDFGEAGGRMRDIDLNLPVPFDDESTATQADRISNNSSSVASNIMELAPHMDSSIFNPVQPFNYAALPPPPLPPQIPLLSLSLALRQLQPSSYAALPPELPALSLAPLSPQPSCPAAPPPELPTPSPPQPSPSAAPPPKLPTLSLPPPPQPSGFATLPPPPPQILPLSPTLALPAAPQPSDYAAPPQPPPHQGKARRQRGSQSNLPDLDSPAPQRRRVSDPDQRCPPSDEKPPHSPSGHQEPQDEVPNEGWNNMGHTPPCQPSGSRAPPSSPPLESPHPPPEPIYAVPSSSTYKLNMAAGSNSLNGFKLVKAFLEDARDYTVFSIRFICNCGARSNHAMKAITDPELSVEKELDCRCRKKYIIELNYNKFYLNCYAGKKKKKNKIGYITGSLASVDDKIDDE